MPRKHAYPDCGGSPCGRGATDSCGPKLAIEWRTSSQVVIDLEFVIKPVLFRVCGERYLAMNYNNSLSLSNSWWRSEDVSRRVRSRDEVYAFIIRWPGKVPAGAVSNEIVHIVDLYPTLARVGGAEVPKDRPIDGVDQLDFFLGKQEHSNREGFPAYVADRLSAVKWRNWKIHFIWQENMYDPPVTLPLPKVINRRCPGGC
jgi:hypothetical protein